MTMREMWNESWNVNTSGTQIMTSTFIPLLLRSNNPRLLFITSGTSTLAGTNNLTLAINKSPAKGWPKSGSFNLAAYRSSKTGMNMMMLEWNRILKEDGVKVWCISPGMLATGLGGNPDLIKKMGGLDPSVGGNFIVSVLEGYRDGDVGKVIVKDGVQAW
jgi:NAD(P)-dependent dehydrogenase (short-subunit alcohol dehydrogenase family)